MEVAEEQATEERSQDSRDTTALGTLTSTLRTGDSATPPAKKEKLTALDMLRTWSRVTFTRLNI